MDFKEVRNYLAKIPNISRGGCGVAAFAMYTWLKQNNQLPDDFKFVLLYCWDDDQEWYENNLEVLRNKKGRAVVPSHLAICINNEIIDADDIIQPASYKIVQYVTEEWFIVNMINESGWNPEFNRDYIKRIEKHLGIDIKEKSEDKSLFERANIFFNQLYSDFI